MAYPDEYRYTNEHEWLKVDGDSAIVGITDHAQDQLGDVVFVELPEVGAKLQAGGPFGAVESVKAVSDIYAPISGDVIEVNESLVDHPEKVNQDPHGEGWLVRLSIAERNELSSLLDSTAYAEYVAAESEA